MIVIGILQWTSKSKIDGHRIEKTCEMHIYKMVYEKTIEENIVKKTNHKCALDDIMLNTCAFLQLKLDLPNWRNMDEMFDLGIIAKRSH